MQLKRVHFWKAWNQIIRWKNWTCVGENSVFLFFWSLSETILSQACNYIVTMFSDVLKSNTTLKEIDLSLPLFLSLKSFFFCQLQKLWLHSWKYLWRSGVHINFSGTGHKYFSGVTSFEFNSCFFFRNVSNFNVVFREILVPSRKIFA